MQIKGIPADEFAGIVAGIGALAYDGNLMLESSPNILNRAGDRFRVRMRVASSRAAGARRSASGRRMPAACWHAFRDVYREAFRRYPNAIIRTGLATYRGRDGFERDYPATAYKNIGSEWRPAYMPELCECEASVNAGTDDCDPALDAPVPTIAAHLIPNTERTIADIDALLASVAADGWTNPYADSASPAHKLANGQPS